MEYLLLSVIVYLWLVGGIFIAIGAADANFDGVARWRIGLLVLGWPFITMYAAFHVLVPELVRLTKRIRIFGRP